LDWRLESRLKTRGCGKGPARGDSPVLLVRTLCGGIVVGCDKAKVKPAASYSPERRRA